MNDTIYAVSSGQAPAAIAVLRISGPAAGAVAVAVAGSIPEPRCATLRRLRDPGGETLDHALVLWFPAPRTVTGEDLLELHLHGGQAVIAVVERAIERVLGTRRAQGGEFTRRGLLAGKIDLAQAAGLADLLAAETEAQRRAALAASEGALSRQVRSWMDRLSSVRAELEAAIDYDEEGDVTPVGRSFAVRLADLASDLSHFVAAPTVEELRRGWQVVIAGPPNAGKSSLFNALVGEDMAIVTPIAGTTRDRITARLQRQGRIVTVIDTAGITGQTDDPVEAIGIALSRQSLATADLVLWLGDQRPPGTVGRSVWLRAKCDERGGAGEEDIAVSARRPDTVARLWQIVDGTLAKLLMPGCDGMLHDDQRAVLKSVVADVLSATAADDVLIRAEHLRYAGDRLGAILGHDATEAMLDSLFARFCVGK